MARKIISTEEAAAKHAARTGAAQGDSAAGWEPYRRALARLRLPPRGPVGSEQNFRRALLVQQCMADVKRKISATGKKSRKR